MKYIVRWPCQSKPKRRRPEAIVKAAVIDWLTIHRCLVIPYEPGYWSPTHKRYITIGKAGVSDVLAVLPGGRLLAVEVKAATGRKREAQELFIERLKCLDALAVRVKSVMELEKYLRDWLTPEEKEEMGIIWSW